MPSCAQACREALAMRDETERPPRIYRHDFVHGIREQERAIQRRNARLRQRQVLAIQVAQGQRRRHLDGPT